MINLNNSKKLDIPQLYLSPLVESFEHDITEIERQKATQELETSPSSYKSSKLSDLLQRYDGFEIGKLLTTNLLLFFFN